MPTNVEAAKCTGCGECIDACPLDAIELKDDVAVINQDECGDCGSCVDVCPSEAISIE